MANRVAQTFLAVVLIASAACGTDAALDVTVSHVNGTEIGRYRVIEIALAHDASAYVNPFWDVLVEATFTSPGGSEFAVEGFYYAEGQWRVRFAPMMTGAWSYQLTLSNGSDDFNTTGSFSCVASDLRGRIRTHPANPKRLIHQDGSSHNTIGTNIWTWMHPFINGSILTGTPEQRWQTYFSTYGASGGNGYRRLLGNEGQWALGGDQHGQVGIWFRTSGPDMYDLGDPSLLTDMELNTALENNFAINLAIYDKPRNWGNNPLNTANGGPLTTNAAMYDINNATVTDLHKKYVRYIVNRYAAYVSIWHIFNEFTSGNGLSEAWQVEIAALIRSLDPYGGFVCNSSTGIAPTLAYQDMRTPHLYMSLAGDDLMTGTDGTAIARERDTWIDSRTSAARTANLPSIYTEFGTGLNMPNDYPDAWRMSVWVAYFCDSGILFWDDNTSLVFNPGGYSSYPRTWNGNAYINDLTRSYFLYRRQFADRFPQTIQKPSSGPTPSGSGLRAYGLEDTVLGLYAAYLHYVQDKDGYGPMVNGRTLTVTLPAGSYRYVWIDPKTGSIVSAPSTTSGGSVTLNVPGFSKDIALAVRPATDVEALGASLPDGALAEDYESFLTARGGDMPYDWSVVAGALPPGLTLNSNSGLINGCPNATGSYAFTVRVIAADSSQNQREYVINVPTNNTPPTVNAGPNLTITFPASSVNLNGSVTDPDSAPVILWSMVSGPEPVAFGNANAATTLATFSAAGVYVLTLTADDGVNPPVSDTMTVTVNTGGAYTISGTVSGDVLSGVMLNLSGAASATTTTDGSGNYSFAGIANGSYTVTPTLSGYTFSPASRIATILSADMYGQNFISTTNQVPLEKTKIQSSCSIISYPNHLGNRFSALTLFVGLLFSSWSILCKKASE